MMSSEGCLESALQAGSRKWDKKKIRVITRSYESGMPSNDVREHILARHVYVSGSMLESESVVLVKLIRELVAKENHLIAIDIFDAAPTWLAGALKECEELKPYLVVVPVKNVGVELDAVVKQVQRRGSVSRAKSVGHYA